MAFFHEPTLHGGAVLRALRLLGAGGALLLTGASLQFATSGPASGRGGAATCARDGLARPLVRDGGEIERLRTRARRFDSVFRYSTRYRVPADLAALVYDVAVREGLDPDLGFRLVKTESGFDSRALSRTGAVGLAQLMPSTARTLMPGVTTEQLFHRETNLGLGFRLLRRLREHYDGDLMLALVAYNGGHGKVLQLLQDGDTSVLAYVRQVMGRR